MFSSKAAANQEWTIGNIVADYNYNEIPFAFEIGVLYKPINLNQAFTSKKVLSKRLYGTEDKYNAIYLSGYTKEEIDQIMNYFKNDVYSIYDMEAYTQECIDQAINGTEMIEIILYVSMLFVTSLVINLFILSYSDRKKQYSELMILGIKKFDLLKSMLIESGMVYLIGTGIGYIVAIPFIKGALCIVKEALIFDTIIHIPYRLISGIIVGCFLVILLFTFIIGVYTLNTDEFNNNNE
jgi:ABC-type antimicrobial peptide transport system permease subunit